MDLRRAFVKSTIGWRVFVLYMLAAGLPELDAEGTQIFQAGAANVGKVHAVERVACGGLAMLFAAQKPSAGEQPAGGGEEPRHEQFADAGPVVAVEVAVVGDDATLIVEGVDAAPRQLPARWAGAGE